MSMKLNIIKRAVLVIFGFIACFILLETGLRLAGFAYRYWQEYQNRQSINDGKPRVYRIFCLGESTTALGGKDSYPSQLEEILNRASGSKRFAVINKGMTGVNTSAIVSELEYYLNSYMPDMVITMMGINDENPDVYFNSESDSPGNSSLWKGLRVYKLYQFLRDGILFRDKLKNIYLWQASRMLDLQRYREAEQAFKEVLKVYGQCQEAYVGLSKCFYGQDMLSRSEDMLEEAVRLPFENNDLFISIGWCYFDLGRYDKAEAIFEKAIELNPEDHNFYVDLAQFCNVIKDHDKAQKMFEKAVSLVSPDNFDERPYRALGWYYLERDMYSEAEGVFQKALAIKPDNLNINWDLWMLNRKHGRGEGSLGYFRKIRRFIRKTRLQTSENYRKLKSIVLKRGIKLVCAQYPMRDVRELKNIFKSQENVIFVDNEVVFRNAVSKGRFEDYFEDKFAGDFGHCTALGNRLLAGNIADTILRERFNFKE